MCESSWGDWGSIARGVSGEGALAVNNGEELLGVEGGSYRSSQVAGLSAGVEQAFVCISMQIWN